MVSIIAAILVITGLGFLFGYALALAAKKFAVSKDERAAAIEELLPGANCGACGFPGCAGYAEAIVSSKAEADLCAPGGAASANGIARIMGVSVKSSDERVARVFCGGGSDRTTQKYRYNGLADCFAVHALFDGHLVCSDGCLGFGSCARVCRFDAIDIDAAGHAHINEDRCTGCGLCAKACPRHLIELVNKKKRVHILCRSHLRGAVCNKMCEVSCIACMRCEKICKQNAIHISDNLAVIDYAACTSCGECVAVCNKKCLMQFPSVQSVQGGHR
ncbi:MAG: RnfABCDGE type electron transport complex subunit B [Spirochaetota bacterium]|nr:RnfABCDGE type electron transport complex subunit B [Spirochaetota bacterium]